MILEMSRGSSSIWVLQYWRRLARNWASPGVTKLMATPFLPKRPERPILWMYLAVSVGRSQLMIRFTCWMSIPLPRRSVEMRMREEPERNSFMTLTRSDISMSPEMQETTNLFSASLSASSLTRSFLLVKTMHCEMTMFLQSWMRVPNFWLSSCSEMQNCLIPSRVSCWFLTRILTGSFMNLSVISMISGGMVAEKRQTWMSEGSDSKISRISSTKPRPSISSASSSTTIFRCPVLRVPLWIRSLILPGVPTTTWMPPFLRALRSSLGSVPPMQQRVLMLMNSLKQKMTLLICCASSRVGARMMAWHSGDLASMSWRTPMEKVAVLPVPDCAWAMVSRLLTTGRMPFC